MRTFVLLLCLLFALSCVKHAAPPPPAAAPPAVLPQFKRLNALHEDFLGFRGDPLFVRHGFTFNSPHADWLQEVQRLERDPDLAEGARALAGLAVAHRQYGAGSVVTRRYETRFARIVRDLPDEPSAPEGTDAAVDTAGAAEPPAAVAEIPVPVDGSPVAEAEAPATLDDGIASVVQPGVPVTGPDGPAAEPLALPGETLAAEAESRASSVEAVAATGQIVVAASPESAAEPSAVSADTPAAEAQGRAQSVEAVAAAALPKSAVEVVSDVAAVPVPVVEASASISGSSTAETQAVTDVSPDAVVDAVESESTSGSSVALGEGFAQPALPSVAASYQVSETSVVENAPAATVVESAGSADDAPAPAVQSLPAVSTVAEGVRPGVTILFSGDTQGVIFPQPGVAGPVGGLARRPPLIGRVRAEDPGVVLVDAGDAFTSGFGRAGRINNVLVRAMNRMGYDAMGLGPHDLALGEVALRELVSIAEFPFVCSNVVFQVGVKPWVKPYVILQRGPFRIGVISLLPPDADAAVAGARIVPPGHALRGVLAELGPKVDGVVLLTQMGSAEVAEIVGGLAVAVVAGDGKASSREVPLYLPAVPKGLGFGRVRLESGEGGALRSAEHGPVLLGEQQDSQMLRLLEELRN